MPYARAEWGEQPAGGLVSRAARGCMADLAALPAAIVKPRGPAGHRRSTARRIGRGVVSHRVRAHRAEPRPARRLVVGSGSGCREIVGFGRFGAGRGEDRFEVGAKLRVAVVDHGFDRDVATSTASVALHVGLAALSLKRSR